MWIIRKRRKINPLKKRKRLCCDYNYKRMKFPKRNTQERNKHCLVHGEEYICDIYECSGIKYVDDKQPSFMPYIN
jgi:hypothetical protein